MNSTLGQKWHSSIGEVIYSDRKNQELTFLTRKHYIDDLEDVRVCSCLAAELEKQQAFSLLAPRKWFDMKVRNGLRGC